MHNVDKSILYKVNTNKDGSCFVAFDPSDYTEVRQYSRNPAFEPDDINYLLYVQAKRYAEGNNVGAGAIRDFCGALDMKKTQKGIFFTTSAFSPSAEETAKAMGKKIVLIDGHKLARLMIRYNIACEDEQVLHLKRIDEEFFELHV